MIVCNFRGCTREVSTFMCELHWSMLPLKLRDRVRAGWVAEAPKSASSLRVLYEVSEFIARELDAKPERDNRGRWERLVRFIRDRDAARGRVAIATSSPTTSRAPVQLRLVP